MRKNVFWFVLVLFHACPLPSQGQIHDLDLQSLMNLALQKNADVRVQSAESRITGLQRRQAVTRWLPQVSADASYIQTASENGLPVFVGANGLKEKLAVLNIQQTVFDAPIWFDLKESSVNKRQQGLQFSATQQQVLFDVIQSYFELLKAQGEVQAFQENLKAFQLIYEQSQMLYDSGVVPEIDVKKSRVEFLLQQNFLIRAQKNVQNVSDQLKELINMPIEQPISVADFPHQNIHLDSLSHYIPVALQENPDLKILKMDLARFGVKKTAVLLSRLPSVNVGLLYGWDTADALNSDNRGLQGFVNVNFPLWRWGNLQAERQIADLQYQQTETRLQQIEKQIIQQVKMAYNECQIQQQQRMAMEESKDQAEAAMQMAEIGYQEGTLTNLDVTNTQKLLTETNINYMSALYDFYVAKAQLYLAMGRLKENFEWIEN